MTADQAKVLAEVIGQGLQSEWMNTYKVIDAVPDAKKDFKPETNSRSAWDLAHHIAICDVGFLHAVAANNFSVFPAKSEREDHSRAGGLVQARVPEGARKDARARRQSPVADRGGVRHEAAVGDLPVFCNNHMIHHRGQLSTYLRPMGGKVPAMYGDSFDEKFPG